MFRSDKSNVGVIEAFSNLIERFGFYTFIFLVLFFFLFNLSTYTSNPQQVEIIQDSMTFLVLLFVVLTLFALFRPKTKEYLEQFWEKNKYMHGGWALSSFFATFVVFLVTLSRFEGDLNENVVYGLLSSKFLLFLNMVIVSVLETLIFAIVLVILCEYFTKSQLWGRVVASFIFAIYHGHRYGWNPYLIFFAFVMNMIFIELIFMYNIRGVSTQSMVISGHASFNLASLGALKLYTLGF